MSESMHACNRCDELERWVRGALTYDPLIDSYKLKDWFGRCPLRTIQVDQKTQQGRLLDAPAKEESGPKEAVELDMHSGVQGSEATALRSEGVGLLRPGQLHNPGSEQQGSPTEGQGGDSSRAQASREVTSKDNHRVIERRPCTDSACPFIGDHLPAPTQTDTDYTHQVRGDFYTVQAECKCCDEIQHTRPGHSSDTVAQIFDRDLFKVWLSRVSVAPAVEQPRPMAMSCPICQKPHIDKGEWATRRHHEHLCEYCGTKWDFGFYSVGVEATRPGGDKDGK